MSTLRGALLLTVGLSFLAGAIAAGVAVAVAMRGRWRW